MPAYFSVKKKHPTFRFPQTIIFLSNKMKHVCVKALCLMGSMMVLTGCNLEIDRKSVETGQFVDSPVSGMSYTTETLIGTTGRKGEFYYKEGESVTFSIGDIHLPSVRADSVVTPLTVFGSDTLENRSVINLSRLLQTLDIDNNLNNGISLPSNLDITTAGLNVEFGALNFDSQVALLVRGTKANSGKLIVYQNAIQHLRASLPYGDGDLDGNWLIETLYTPKTATKNSSDFNLTLEHAKVFADQILTTTELSLTQTPLDNVEFDSQIEPSNLSLVTAGTKKGELSDAGTRFSFAYLNKMKDVAFGVNQGITNQLLSVMVKSPYSMNLYSLMGTWKEFIFQTPKNGSGDPAAFDAEVNKVTIQENGSAIRTPLLPGLDQSLMFDLVDANNMVIPVSNNDNFAINVSHSVMIAPRVNSSNYIQMPNQRFAVLLKEAEGYVQSDLEGTWFGVKFSSPRNNQSSDLLYSQELTQLNIDEHGNVGAFNLLTRLPIEFNNFKIMLNTFGEFSTSPVLGYDTYWGMDETKSVIVILAKNENNAQSITLLLKQGDME